MAFGRAKLGETDENRVRKFNAVVDALNQASGAETLAEHEAAANPHPQYLTEAEGNALYDPSGAAAGLIAAHEAESDPHPQYLTEAEGDAAYDALGAATASMNAHLAAGDPHPQYLTPAEGNAAYDALGAATAGDAAHVAAADPHPQYQLEAEFGQRSITGNTVAIAKNAAADQTLSDNADYTQVTGIFNAVPDGHNVGVTQQTNSFTVNKSGYYKIEFWASTRASANNTQLAFRFAINGTIAIGRRPSIFMRNASEVHSGSAFGFHLFTAGDVVTLWIASTNTANITIQDAVFGVTAIRYT